MHKYYVHSKYFSSEWAARPIFIIGLYRTHNKVRVLRANNRSKVSYLSRLLQVIKYLQIESLNELKKMRQENHVAKCCVQITSKNKLSQ